MNNNIFEIELEKAKINYEKIIKKNNLIKLFSLGLFNIHNQVEKYKEILKDRYDALYRYSEICKRENILTESFNIDKLPNIRIGSGTNTGVKVIGGEEYGNDWEIIRMNILSRDDRKCQESDGSCSGPLQVHHIVPLSQGGTNDNYNLTTLCLYHHSLKHDHMKGKL